MNGWMKKETEVNKTSIINVKQMKYADEMFET